MPEEPSDIDWTNYFHHTKKGVSDGKFKVMRQPVPLVQDYHANVKRVMEFLWRCGRNADVTDRPESMVVPVRDFWFIADHASYEGVYYHCCEPVRMMMYYTRYQLHFEQWAEARRDPSNLHNIQDLAEVCRKDLWGTFNSTGQNSHFFERDAGQFFEQEWRDVPRTRANDILEFHSCSRCIKPLPKQIILVNKLQRSKLQDVL